jgi:hypothetical protein
MKMEINTFAEVSACYDSIQKLAVCTPKKKTAFANRVLPDHNDRQEPFRPGDLGRSLQLVRTLETTKKF